MTNPTFLERFIARTPINRIEEETFRFLDNPRNEPAISAFCEIAHELREKYPRYRAAGIIHIMRWTMLEISTRDELFKINDHLAAGLARLAIDLGVVPRSFFKLKELKPDREARENTIKAFRRMRHDLNRED